MIPHVSERTILRMVVVLLILDVILATLAVLSHV